MDTWCFTIYLSLAMTVPLSPTKADIWPAEIFGKTTEKAGGQMQLRCSIFDESGLSSQLNMYLCKNGVAVRMQLLVDEKVHIFVLRNVSVLDSGNYSCVYSLNKYVLKNLTVSGQKSIQVQITEPILSETTNEQSLDEFHFTGFLLAYYVEILLASLAVFLGMVTGIIICLCCRGSKPNTEAEMNQSHSQSKGTDENRQSDSDDVYINADFIRNARDQRAALYANVHKYRK